MKMMMLTRSEQAGLSYWKIGEVSSGNFWATSFVLAGLKTFGFGFGQCVLMCGQTLYVCYAYLYEAMFPFSVFSYESERL